MPRCAECKKARLNPFKYKIWNSSIYRRELNGKFLCEGCYAKISKEEIEFSMQLEGNRICPYCGTERNIKQFPTCPKCGA